MRPSNTKKLTAQPVRTRHFAGKPAAVEVEERSSSESESEEEQPKQKPFAKPKPAPIASSFPKAAIRSKLAARQQSEADRKALENEFETESEGEGEGDAHGSDSDSDSTSGDGDDSSEESSSSEEEAPRKLLRPVFLKKNERNKAGGAPVKSAEELAAEEETRRQQEARALVQEQVEQRIAEKAASKRDWDDDVEDTDMNAVDDTDGLDADAEYAAWKFRELKRIRRERLAIEEAEAERAELERRRNLPTPEREAEDAAFKKKQEDERADRTDMAFMQKYHHKGAFYTDALKELGIDKRNLMGARFEDQINREVLPEFMQIRDMTKLGKKGRTKYKDMKSEDTGKWADYGNDRPRKDKIDYSLDDRFRPDTHHGYGRDRDDREGATGANAKPLGERKRFGDGDRDGHNKRPRV